MLRDLLAAGELPESWIPPEPVWEWRERVRLPDVVVVSDGGGFVAAARRPIQGAERVAGLLIRGLRSVDFEAKAVWLNGSPAIRLDIGGQVDTAVSLAVENGRITRIYAIRNPHKLAHLHGAAALTRT